ncbi:MAG: AEC family transporter, partial [Acidimicrobiales bacterium]
AIALGLSGDERGVVVIQSAMPPAVFTMVVAMEHDLEPERVTANLVNMTLLSLVTLPVVLALVVG